ncbi:unnamed protein product [Lactuca virosa]|uniref:ATP citrate synthase n=1 Tax=Lactuca virosa TaxID=75947 RepID=A0AAU9LPA1_9ASTR|nr:unnamed protein product [Lactuca virosa]
MASLIITLLHLFIKFPSDFFKTKSKVHPCNRLFERLAIDFDWFLFSLQEKEATKPESDTKELISYARSNNKVVIGPATVGGIQAGAFKIGDTAGTIDNIIQCKLYRPGSVGFVSKSLYNIIVRVTDGIYEGIAIGGDVFPGSTLSDHVLRFNNIPQIKMIVVLGELGGRDEYSLVEALKSGKINKPVCAWVSGTCARLFKSEVQFGHVGAKSGGEMESAQAKNEALKDAGAVVPTSFESFEASIKETYEKLAEEGKITPVMEITPPHLPPKEVDNWLLHDATIREAYGGLNYEIFHLFRRTMRRWLRSFI